MQFEVQGQSYFLKYHEGDGRWYLLRPTADGVTGMPVLDDSAPVEEEFVIQQEPREETIN